MLGGLVGAGTGFLLARLGVHLDVVGSGLAVAAPESFSRWPSWASIAVLVLSLRSRARLIQPAPELVRPAERDSRDFSLLHRPSCLRDRPVAGLRAGRRRVSLHAAGGAVSRGDAPYGAGDGPLPRRQRHDRAQHRGSAHRRAGQRRRGHDVHVLTVAPTTAPTF